MKTTYIEEVSNRLVTFGQQRFGNEHGWQTKFAKALDMLPQGLQPYLNAERLPGNTVLARLNKLGCSSDWLLYGDTNDAESLPIGLMNIPVYSFSEGTKENVVMESIVDYIAIPKSTDATLFGVKIKGDAMEPSIKSGDIVIVSEEEKWTNGDICLVQWNKNHYSLRSVQLQDKQFILTADSAEKHPPMVVPKTKIQKIMRVMKIIRSL